MEYSVCWLPKEGNSVEEYEDAYAAEPGAGRFAIADGASESSYAGLWARLLVQGFVHEPASQPQDWLTWLPPLQKAWRDEVGDRPRPWNVEAKIQAGGFATFLGLTIGMEKKKDGERRWTAIAIGDCCLFHLRAGQLRRAFPIERPTDFSNRPRLVGSRQPPTAVVEQLQTHQGAGYPGDQLWLMTDALAQWFLGQHEAGRALEEAIAPLLSGAKESLAAWVVERTKRQEMRADDVTLLAVQL
jgi:hypothetical protein